MWSPHRGGCDRTPVHQAGQDLGGAEPHGSDVAMPWCGLVCQQGADRGDALPYVRIVRRAAILLVLGGVYACVPRPGRHTICVFPPLVLSFAAKVVGGREVGEYEVGLVWLEGEESRQAVFSWAGGQLGHHLIGS